MDFSELKGDFSRPLATFGDRHVEASSVVQVDAIAAEDAMRIANSIGSAIKGRDTA